MSLSVSGIIAIVSVPERIELKGGKNVMYVFDAVAADTYDSKKRHKYKGVSVTIPLSEEDKAAKRLVKNKVIQIHYGRWIAEEKPFGEKTVIYNKLAVSWYNISVLEWASKKKGESDEQPN